MTCDGTLGNPGVYTMPTPEGPEVVACTGCYNCKPINPTAVVDEMMDSIGQVVDSMVTAINQLSRSLMAPPPKNRALRRALRYDHNPGKFPPGHKS